MSEFGKLLKKYRCRCRHVVDGSSLTQAVFAELIDKNDPPRYNASTISRWERGRRQIDWRNRAVLLQIIDVLYTHGGIQSLEEANSFLRTGQYSALIEAEVRLTSIESQGSKQLQTNKKTHPLTKNHDYIYDFSRYIAEKTTNFTGRQWVFDLINRFLEENQRGYFFLIGEPGIGKTSIAAQLTQENQCIHHFNIRAEGIHNAAVFLQNVCAQLIVAYNLDYATLPIRTTDDAGILNELLKEVSEKLDHTQNERCIMVIDALDEVVQTGNVGGINRLYLPHTLPKGIYIVVTMRNELEIIPRVDCEHAKHYVEADSIGNLRDITHYIEVQSKRDGIQQYVAKQQLEENDFIELMTNKSEGNFMYLYYVLPEIEKGAYHHYSLDIIPRGLQGYYDDHWRRMKGVDTAAWFDHKLPVIMALTQVKKPVSIDLIIDFSQISNQRLIRAVLNEWHQFFYHERVAYEGEQQSRYRIYHASFHDFLAQKEEVKDERVSRKDANLKIVDSLWGDLFGGKDT